MLRFIQHSTSPLPTRQLGKTGVTVPILGFGTAAAGRRLNTGDAVRLYETAFRAGITYFDTAPEFAGYGKAQIQLSHLLKHVRSQVFLVTKCYEPDGERALQLLERSLKELGTTYADVVFVHSVGADKMDPTIVFSKHGTYAALMKAKSLGLARFVGLSGHNRPSRFLQALRHVEIDVLLNAVNFVDRHTYNFEERLARSRARQHRTHCHEGVRRCSASVTDHTQPFSDAGRISRHGISLCLEPTPCLLRYNRHGHPSGARREPRPCEKLSSAVRGGGAAPPRRRRTPCPPVGRSSRTRVMREALLHRLDQDWIGTVEMAFCGEPSITRSL